MIEPPIFVVENTINNTQRKDNLMTYDLPKRRLKAIILVFLFIYFFSGPLEYMGFQNRMMTAVGYFLMYAVIFLENKRIIADFNLFRALFFVFLVLKLITYFLVYDNNYILQPFVAFSQFFLLILLLQLTESKTITEKIKIDKIISYSLFYLLIISIIQYLEIEPINNIISNYGGNFTGGRLIGNTFIKRVNGGIGGTVIDFSVLIILTNYINIFLNQKTRYYIINYIVLFILFLLSSSRVTLISYLFILITQIILLIKSKLNPKKKIFVIMTLLFSLIALSILFNQQIIILLSELFIEHDESVRLSQWRNSFNTSSLLIGNDLGRNTGLTLGGKVVYDGLFFAVFNDMGIIGLALYILVIFEPLVKIKKKFKKEYRILIYLLIINIIVINIINSGFDYHLNILLYFFLIITLKNSKYIEKSQNQG